MSNADRITRDDIESKFREIQGNFDERAAKAKSSAVPIGIGLAILLLILAYVLGKRVGKAKSTIVEIRRL